MDLAYLADDPYNNISGRKKLKPRFLKNGHIYRIKPFKKKIQLIEQENGNKDENENEENTQNSKNIAANNNNDNDNNNTTTTSLSLKAALNSIKLFVNEYALGGTQNDTGWFWFIVFFVFCVIVLCMLIRIQVRLDTIAGSMYQTAKEMGAGTFRLVRQ